jgi:ribosomal-protein-alanine N-acetyltransferase
VTRADTVRRSGDIHVGAVEVVQLTSAHLDQVLAIEADAATTGWSRRIFERELAEHASRCYLAAVHAGPRGTTVVGYAGMQVLVDEAHITTMTVRRRARRRGIATRLLVELLREARARGVASAMLDVRIDNMGARRLYAGFGFRPVGVRPAYYDAAVDALIMWLHDVGGAEVGRLLRARDPRAGASPSSTADPGEA